MLSVRSLWRYFFLLGTYSALLLLLLVWRYGGTADLRQWFGATEVAPVEAAAPVRLRIPRLQVDVPIRSVGMTADGKMEVPKEAWETGWFRFGAIPGQAGNAVIAGHLDTILGTPAVFAKLHTLAEGDSVVIDDVNGQSHRFLVTTALTYDADAAPLEKIFGAADTPQLQLITCDGAWLEHKRTYQKRLVVSARADTGPSSTAASASGDTLLAAEKHWFY